MERVGVVGCGLMGSGIAEVTARAGSDVTVVESDDAALTRGRERVETSLRRAVAAGKMSEEEVESTRARLRFSTDLGDLADRELVIEAVAESPSLKLQVFGEIDRIVTDPHAILATNTSSIPIVSVAMATARPEYVVGVHFFNPVPVLRLVEVIASLRTSEDVVERVTQYARDVLHKRVITAPDRAGFVVNALLVPYLLSAIRMYEGGFASAEDIDTGMVEGCAHPMGPLALTDLIGLDTALAVADSLYEEFKEPQYAAPPLLARMVQAGLLGRKSGEGFFSYRR